MSNIFITMIELVEETKQQLPFLAGILGILWGSYVATLFSGNALLVLGIHPRRLIGLPGIIFSPFLHGSFSHLLFNSIPLIVLSDFILMQGKDLYLSVTLYLILLSGTLTWCIGRPVIHVGASSVITGYWSLLIMAIFHSGGSPITLILGFVCIYYFAGIFFGIFPTQAGVSWEGHLAGLFSGVVLYYLMPWLLPILPLAP